MRRSFRRRDIVAAILLPGGIAAAARRGLGAAPAAVAGSSASIRAVLARQIDEGHLAVGCVAYVADTAGPDVVGYGRFDAADSRTPNGDSVFEIGSITKLFTALLLTAMAERGEVALDDPITKYLPASAAPRSFDGKPISLIDLATHSSGLPRMPGNFRPADPANPYADYSVERLYAFLSGYMPAYFPGSHFGYSNLGFGLLGHVLALRSGQSYEDLVVSRICEPLGLADTRITLTPSMRQRLVPGHDAQLRRVANWTLDALAGAGALRSTANDLMRLLEAFQGKRASSLAPAMRKLLDIRRQTDQADCFAAAGWFVWTMHGDEIICKDGGTGGYGSFLGYSNRSGKAAVLLFNSFNNGGVGTLGLHLLNADFPEPPVRRQIAIEPARLSVYTGRYALAPDFVLTIRATNGRLIAQATGQEAAEIFAQSGTEFFYRAVDAQISFELSPKGTPVALTLHQNGRDLRGVRLQ